MQLKQYILESEPVGIRSGKLQWNFESILSNSKQCIAINQRLLKGQTLIFSGHCQSHY